MRKIVYTLTGLFLGLILTVTLFGSTVNEVYDEIYRDINIGYFISIVHVFFLHTKHPYITLLLWFLIGLLLSIIAARRMFTLGLYISFVTFLLIYIPLLINGIIPLPHTLYGEYVLISTYIFPLLVNGIVCGLGCYIGGLIRKPKEEILSPDIEKKLLSSIPIKCPKCGYKVYSNPLYCSNCGEKIKQK